MLDFLDVIIEPTKNGVICKPDYSTLKHKDLMIQGGDFKAIYIKELGLWSTDERDAISIIDKEVDDAAEAYSKKFGVPVKILHLRNSSTRMIKNWHTYCQDDLRDDYHALDSKVIFSNMETKREDYASQKTNYPLIQGECPSYELIMSTLYSPEERHKLEWAIGAVVTGDSKNIQKFIVLYGPPGSGKSTVLNIIQQLFKGYIGVFDAKALGDSKNGFSLEPLKKNPLVAIQHDGDLSKIEDNTKLNSLVSHEVMSVNTKNRAMYTERFNSFLFMGTNKPVKITDAKSGLLRRLIDVTPSGNKLDVKEYKRAMKQIEFELGAIAYHCMEVYKEDPEFYDDYIPVSMMGSTNYFYDFVMDSFLVFKKEDGVTLTRAFEMYKNYCQSTNSVAMTRMAFKEELKNYFEKYDDRISMDDGTRVRSYYSGFKDDIFTSEKKPDGKKERNKPKVWLEFAEPTARIFETACADCLAQYASDKETPSKAWDSVKTKLSSIDISRLHYVKVPENHIVIDFDIPDESGNKCFEKNWEAASKWPPTYAELSKSGQGIHLHYIYTGDATKLSRIYDDHIEIKVFSGKSSLRRKLTKCNSLDIAPISSGLPLKGEKMVDFNAIKSEKGLRVLIERNLNKEIHSGTKPSIDFIYKILEDAYNSGLPYDVTDMRNAIYAFAAHSTHQADYCMKIVDKMQFKSAESGDGKSTEETPIVFYDIEVFPNLFLVNWKIRGKDKPVVRMINPSPSEIEELMKFRLIGFNCRRYDNHLIYARMMGYTNEQLYNLSKRIVSGESKCFFSEAYNVSYTDVYDFASAGNKKSLKKLEIEMGIHHQELGLPWDEPVPEELWTKVAEYCDNDVIATEAAFDYLSADWTARQILADLAEMTVNDTTNSLTTRIIFGKNRTPQSAFNYRNLAEPVFEMDEDTMIFLKEACPDMMSVRHGEEGSLLPYFPGYEFKNGKSTYRGEEVGEGGYVYSEPGMYGNVALLDIASMHPHSTIAECLFGVEFTTAYRDIVEGRVSIKHEAWDVVNGMLNGKLTPYIQKVINGEMTSAQLANALKTAINSVYGLTSAKFENPFRDKRNVDNIVAKRGALFMIDLKHEVQKRGFTVAHIKTDSIKIPDATPEIIEFVMEFGKKYGYTFEHEATYDRMCLVNKAVYIAKYKDGKHTGEWTATGDQFAVPYVYKKLFTHEDITFDDLCETFAVSKGDLYLDTNETLTQLTPEEEKELDELDKAWHAEKPEAMDKFLKKYKYDAEFAGQRYSQLCKKEESTHDMHFVGRVGQFTPIKDGNDAGLLYRVQDGKKYAAPGSTGYRWMESEMVRETNKQNCVDMRYYDELATNAVTDICVYGDFTWFVSDDPYVGPEFVQGDYMMHPLYSDTIPFK